MVVVLRRLKRVLKGKKPKNRTIIGRFKLKACAGCRRKAEDCICETSFTTVPSFAELGED